MTPLRIAILSLYLPPAYSGAGMQALRLGIGLRKLGHSVFFVTARCPGVEPAAEAGGCEVHAVDLPRFTGAASHLLFAIKAARVLVRKRKDYDLLFSPGMGGLLGILFLAVRVMGKKIVLRMSLFLDSPLRLRRRKSWPYLLLPYRLADAVVVPSSASLSELRAYYPDKPVLRLNNCIDTEAFRPPGSHGEKQAARERLGLDPDGKYVIYVGRIIRRKGVEFLARAWREVCRKYEGARLLLVGPADYASKGEMRSADPVLDWLRSYLETCGISETVTFAGETDRVHEFLLASDVFVFASRAEGLPSAPLEAMSSGLPAVVLDIPGVMSDIIESGREGFILPPGDVPGFAETVVGLLRDGGTGGRMGARARERVLRDFSTEVVSRRYAEAFAGLLANGGSPPAPAAASPRGS